MHHLIERLNVEMERLRDLARACHLQALGHANHAGQEKQYVIFTCAADALTTAAVEIDRGISNLKEAEKA